MKINMKVNCAVLFCAVAYGANASSFMDGYKVDVLKDSFGHVVLSNNHDYLDLPSINNKGSVSGNSGGSYFGGAFVAFQVSGERWDLVSLPNMKVNGGYNKVYAMNDNDQMVGYSTSADNKMNAVLWSKNSSGAYVASSLRQDPSDDKSFAYDINNSGYFVGGWVKGTQSSMLVGGFVPSNPTVANASAGHVISNSGIYAGAAQGIHPGFVSDNNTKVDAGNYLKYAEDINDKGLVVYYGNLVSNDIKSVAYDYSTRKIVRAGLDGASAVRALGTNNSDDIVGSSYLGTQKGSHAFITRNGVDADLSEKFSVASGIGWRMLTAATDINDKGQIIGLGDYFDGKTTQHNAIFLLNPVPEPETYAMMLAGLSVVGWSLRKRKLAMH